ncbi:ABC drug exporter AtrF [Saitoella complicata NRRL Y-17804]|nr:ABC drug exporter AtrF [Saitoella complicata NRRL Y-17804]ODQ56128.1 ABC drug exporter AtrF [Saitoella complicata NRRL Y-17804]
MQAASSQAYHDDPAGASSHPHSNIRSTHLNEDPSHNYHRDERSGSDSSGTLGDNHAHLTRTTSQSQDVHQGRYGEQIAGTGVDVDESLSAFEDLRRQLTNKSRASHPVIPEDEEKSAVDNGDEFHLEEWLKGRVQLHHERGLPDKKIGVLYKDLTVLGIGSGATMQKTLPDAIIGSFGPDLWRFLQHFVPPLQKLHFGGARPEVRELLRDFVGVVRGGEMMLVLGRPGAGCSTFLRTIANQRESFAGVNGTVEYGGMTPAEIAKRYRGEVNYNPEDDIHFPTLKVRQTLGLALQLKTPKKFRGEVQSILEALGKMFGISHTFDTVVGNEYVRGVSGGERKRVSIAETLTTRSAVVCWDQSSRGLDASTAVDFVRSLRVMTDITHRATFLTLYQAGEGIFRLCDKVTVIDQGRLIFSGPRDEAKPWFESLGYECPERQTTADFLTSVTDPAERRFRKGWEGRAPKGAEELEAAFRGSEGYRRLVGDVEAYQAELGGAGKEQTEKFKESVVKGKSKHVAKKSPYTVSFPRQVLACTKRQFWLMWNDKTSLYTKLFITVSIALIIGSLFYGQPPDSTGAFSRGGALFFSILFLGWLQLSELMDAVSGRIVIQRHKDYAFYRPSAVSVARVLADLPILFVLVSIFCVVMYFMCNFQRTASQFFIYYLFVYTTTICITALYRMFAALSPDIVSAIRFSGLALNLLVIFTGYVIPKPQLLNNYIWFGWLLWINPVAYAFEGVVANEFYNLNIQCADAQTVPVGPTYTNPAYQGCTLAGSTVGSPVVSGAAYIETAYNYSRSNLWRNWGVVVAFTVLYILVGMIASELLAFVPPGASVMVFKKTKRSKKAVATSGSDEESGGAGTSGPNAGAAGESDEAAMSGLEKSESVFTWQGLSFEVPIGGGNQKKLLNDVMGYCKPGQMTALMGASGAGKTTLLNTLAQRQTVGVVTGDMLVDGRALGVEFQRGTGFCEQMDLHEGTATIRESLEFSALLRQSRDTPREEKLAYVDTIIKLLELEDIQDAIVGSLDVEPRKRLTIGVELCAKPKLLLFLDEPTSGLDSQSAYNIVRFLRKLADSGQAILCTIHQPSSILIQQFDRVLALNPGGNTFYFGPIGENGKDVIEYFGQHGAHCDPNANVAEFLLEVGVGNVRVGNEKKNWNKVWRESKECKSIAQEIEDICASRKDAADPNANVVQHEYAAPLWEQCKILTQRTWRNYWRDSSYGYGKIFTSVMVGIFNGFTFYMLGNSSQDMQNRMFSVFLILMIPPTIVNATVPKFFMNRALWEVRENPSRIYNWFAFSFANTICEIPYAFVTATIYFLLWYFPAGLPYDGRVSAHVWLMVLLWNFFQASWGQWICAFAPSYTVISNVLPFFFVMVSTFNGVVRPYASLPVFWKYWMYYLNPSTYWIGSVLASTLAGQPVECTSSEVGYFNPPPGETCLSYASTYLNSGNAVGYLMGDQSATSNCMYCPYSVGDNYLSAINVSASDKWPYFAIFLGFTISNWVLVYAFIYMVRVRRWTFGFGPAINLLGKVLPT